MNRVISFLRRARAMASRLLAWSRGHIKTMSGGLLLALLVAFFGDNWVGRYIYGSEPEQQRVDASGPEPAIALPAAPSPIDNPTSATTGGALFDAVCSAKSVTVTFAALRSDPERFRRRAGATIVRIMGCSVDDRTFRTKVDDYDTLGVDGTVNGDQVQFRYRYGDSEGIVDCRVTAAGKIPDLVGSISCEAIRGAMKLRPAKVSVPDVVGSHAPNSIRPQQSRDG